MFVSHHTLKWTRTCRSHGRHPHAHTAHFLLNRHSLSARNFPARQAVGQPRISPCSADRRRHPSRSVTKPLPLWVPRWRFMRTASVNSSCNGSASLRTGRKVVPARRHYGMRTHRSRLLPANWPCRVRHAVSHVMHSLSSKARCPIGTSPIWLPHPWDT